jgi:hypothetical protein
MYLKRVPPKSLQRPHPAKNCFSTRGGPQGPRRPRFSFFRFNFQTARGKRPPSRASRKVSKLRAPDNRRMLIHCSSEELRRRAIAPIADGAPRRVYRVAPLLMSTSKQSFLRCGMPRSASPGLTFHRPKPGAINLCAALKPYSCDDPLGSIRGGHEDGAPQPFSQSAGR